MKTLTRFDDGGLVERWGDVSWSAMPIPAKETEEGFP